LLDLPTRPDAALLYRLSGDLNPLHIDPAIAAKAGFARPILHGLASFGAACHGLVRSFCDYDPTRLKSIRARLSSPVYPGETIQLACWRVDGGVAFRGRVGERDVVVLSHGMAGL
jgi:acyl dehydratase